MYYYKFACGGGKVGLWIYTEPIQPCTVVGTACGYFTFYFGYRPTLVPTFYAEATPEGCDGAIRATFNFRNNTSCPDLTIPPPVSQATLYFPIEQSFPKVCCYPCPIPKKDLVLEWTNSLIGDGSTILHYNEHNIPPESRWSSNCDSSDGNLYGLDCDLGSIRFSIKMFVSGYCPKGQWVSCDHPAVFGGQRRLIRSNVSCSPFSLSYSLTHQSCQYLSTSGYTGFTIHE